MSTKTYLITDIATDSSGYSNTINTTDTDAHHGGSGITGHYYACGYYCYFDDFADDSIDITKWCRYVCCAQQGTGQAFYWTEVNSGLKQCIVVPPTSNYVIGLQCVCSMGYTLDINKSLYICAYLTQNYNSFYGTRGIAAIKLGGQNIVCRTDGGSALALWKVENLNNICYDVYCNNTCLCQIQPTNQTITIFTCGGATNIGGGSATAVVCMYGVYQIDSGGLNVYINCNHFDSEVKQVYATACTKLDSETCVTYDILSASDCSRIAGPTALNNVTDLTGCNECNVIVRYNLCSNNCSCCACLCRFSYVVVA